MTIVWFDFETRSPVNLKSEGAYKYATHPETEVLCLALAFDDGDPIVWSPAWCHPDGVSGSLTELPLDRILAALKTGVFAAFNAAFDRHIWNKVLRPKYQAPALPIERVIDVQAQAEASACPPGLEGACRALGTPFQKNKEGKSLIRELCIGTRADWQDTPEIREKMRRFRIYARDDITSMRDVFKHTRPLTAAEWVTYQASEKVNDRGIPVDVEFAEAATKYAASEKVEINDQLQELSGDGRMSIHTHSRNALFVHGLLETAFPDIAALIERDPCEKTGEARFGMDKETRDAILGALDNPDLAELDHAGLNTAREFIETVEAGSSAAVSKYRAIVSRAAEDKRVRGAYAYNGGGQTGRWSSRGTQWHNLIKDSIGDDPNLLVDLKDAVVEGDEARVAELLAPHDLSLTRALGRLLRSTIVASEGHDLVWGDLASIEAVVLPWLSNTSGGRKRLDSFRARRDLYIESAAEMHKVPYESISEEDPRRQEGKIAELSLGFLGGAGALMGMARKFGRLYARDEAQGIVDRWREANSWAPAFGNRCMAALDKCLGAPRMWVEVGRIAYRFEPKIMKGSVFCRLPSGRLLAYPEIKTIRTMNEERGTMRTEVTYRKSWGKTTVRNSFWRGILLENATQATANDLLRRLVEVFADVAVFHTHDEIGLEVPIAEAEMWKVKLEEEMTFVPPWAEGLPIRADVKCAPFYYKD